MLYEVTYERNRIYHSNLAEAKTIESVKRWFKENKPSSYIVAIKDATSDSMKPGKPLITVSRGV